MLNYAFTLLAAVGAGAIVGGSFAFAAGDQGVQIIKTVTLGMIFSVSGWILVMAIPIVEFKGYAADGFAIIAALWGSHAYWAAVKRRSNILNQIDIIPGKLLNGRHL
jgi:hypothetical protein